MRIERLDEEHHLADFTCGNKRLDDWLTRHALENDRRGLSKVYVLVTDAAEIAGYYSVTMASVTKRELPRKLGRSMPDAIEIGAPLLGRLAVASEYQGQGYGVSLLVAAVGKVGEAAELVGARFIAVDPIDEPARAWYRKWGFTDIPGDERGRMYVRIDEALAAIYEAW